LALFLLIPDARRLVNLFFMNRPAEAVPANSLFRRPLLNRGAAVLGSLFLIGVVGVALYQSYDQRRFVGQRSPLYGVWEVEEFNLGNGPATAGTQHWRRVIFDTTYRMGIQTTTDAHERFGLQLDQEKRTLTLRRREDPNWHAVLNYQEVSPEVLSLTGDLGGSQLTARLRRKDEPQFLLTNRGFHWINEFPFNR
jgi:hypothetical protein